MSEVPFRAEAVEAGRPDSFSAVLSPSASPCLIRLEGPCPRCGHSTSHVEPLVLVHGIRDARPEEQERLARQAAEAIHDAGLELPHGRQRRDPTLICACGVPHPDSPADRHGCGASWRLHLEWEA